MMDEKTIQEMIAAGRRFAHSQFGTQTDYLSDQQQKKPQPPLVKARMSDTPLIRLPRDFESLSLNRDVIAVMEQRKSSRVFTEQPLTLSQLSWLLWASQGVREIRGKSYATLRTVPSGGARHGFETYLVIRKCESLPAGAYHYLPMEHALEWLHPIENLEESVVASLCDQRWTARASVVFYWSLMAYRCEWRYSFRAHRVALIDAGHVGQNLYLAAAAAGLGTCAIAAFDDEIANGLFDLDGEEEFIVYSAPAGTIQAADQKKEKEFYRFVEEEGL